MKLTFNEIKSQTIDLPQEAVLEVVKKYMEQLLSPGEYVREEKRGQKTVKVLKQDDPEWRHGSVSEEYVRDATDLDLAALEIIRHIHDSRIKSKK